MGKFSYNVAMPKQYFINVVHLPSFRQSAKERKLPLVVSSAYSCSACGNVCIHKCARFLAVIFLCCIIPLSGQRYLLCKFHNTWRRKERCSGNMNTRLPHPVQFVLFTCAEKKTTLFILQELVPLCALCMFINFVHYCN